MNSDNQFGYFHIIIKNDSSKPLFNSNNERAFVLSFLQHTLSMRTLIESPLGYRSIAVHIDLLAFSLTRHACQLVVFSISRRSATVLCRQLCQELKEYREAYYNHINQKPLTTITPLTGPHDALHHTVLLHQQHKDWEYDRYSSIGFYLHDRRGDWMRLWRLVQLYDCDPEKYRNLITPPALQAINA